MAIAALAWAIKQQVARSSSKFVLVMLANYANEQGHAYPSVERLSQDTGQNRKTILAALSELKKYKLIADTGRRVGATGKVVVYQLPIPDKNEVVPKTGLLETVPKTDGNSPKNGRKQSRFYAKQSLKRDSDPLLTVSDPSGTNGSAKKASVWEMKQAVEAMENLIRELQNNHAYEDGFGWHWDNLQKRREWQRAKGRVKELNQRIALAV